MLQVPAWVSPASSERLRGMVDVEMDAADALDEAAIAMTLRADGGAAADDEGERCQLRGGGARPARAKLFPHRARPRKGSAEEEDLE